MGEARRRGTYEERKAMAIERDRKAAMGRQEVETRKPSPKHMRMVSALAGLTAGNVLACYPKVKR